jgi:UDP-N-acetylmuramoyl-tripeptide--D-alanyl-D-alanine ligase
MFWLKGQEVASLVRGKIISGKPDCLIKNISTDSRTIKKGDFFIPLKGENLDGHHFIEKALAKGATGALFEKGKFLVKEQISALLIEVDDTLKALQRLANGERLLLGAKVIAVTGSTGKTTTKDMLFASLSRSFSVTSAPKNFNNEIGVPLTLLKADKNTEIIISELAMRGLGQIKELAEIVKPDIGIVTNVGEAHLEFVGSLKAVALAKAELLQEIPEHGLVILNADDKWTNFLRQNCVAPVITVGLNKADISANQITFDEFGRAAFTITSKTGSIRVKLPILGRHNIYAALIATAVSLQLGMKLEEIKQGLESVCLTEGRLDLLIGKSGQIILNSSYNANPMSVRASVEALKMIKKAQRHIAVLGDMLELGLNEDRYHKEIGRFVAEKGVDYLITIGDLGQLIAKAAIDFGMNGRVKHCQSVKEAQKVIVKLVQSTDAVLIKASRAMHLESLVEALI